ncbi:hypothetical protein HY992_04150 [Candidatus Micrarchaeota archaeon]|nr:hypothetical protein [Candidatus Micrarchaeota archaeon]
MKLKCLKCKEHARKIVLPTYEYVKGVTLQNVAAFECPKCRELVFTEKQVGDMEKRADAIKAHLFAFVRKITVSGRSLVINIPEDVVRHMRLSKGKKTKLFPIDDKRLLLEVA